MTDRPEPWEPGSSPAVAGKRHAPATLRNRDAILSILRDELPSSGLVLEVASGSGEHAIHFAAALPNLDWQPSDPDPTALGSIEAWRRDAGLPNLLAPIQLDAANAWPIEMAAAIVCINMVHISSWAATVGLFRGAAKLLRAGAPLILYGPYIEGDVQTAPSNLAFHQSLQDRNPNWGLRDAADVDHIAAQSSFRRTGRTEMPANNLTLIYRRG